MTKLSINPAHAHILEKYGLTFDAWLSRGMEAEVYAYESEAVLKLYGGTASLANLGTLKDFYDSLDRQTIPYDLPYILKIEKEEGFVVAIERRLEGTKLSDRLSIFTATQMDEMMERYLTAALALAHIQMPPSAQRYQLFDPENLSQQTHGDWHQFLWRYVSYKLTQLASFFSRDVANFATKLQKLQDLLSQPYRGDYGLIHGDFFPGNLLVNDDLHIAALLDFGLFTMYGDTLFDIATGWVFFDMYDELEIGIRDRYLKVVINRLSETVRGKLYRYVLIYSLLSANAYSPDCTDGHYQWCVANLNNQSYWNTIE